MLIFLANCTSKVHIGDVEVSTPTGLKKIEGNYAAYIQTGGWVIGCKAKGWECSAWTYEMDINHSYKKAMQQLLENSLEKVTFFEKILTKEELRNGGFLAQISILQGDASSGFAIHQGFFTSNVEVTVDLSAIVSSFGLTGLQFQKDFNVNGKGYGEQESFQLAAKNAIIQLTEIGALYIREGLRSVT